MSRIQNTGNLSFRHFFAARHRHFPTAAHAIALLLLFVVLMALGAISSGRGQSAGSEPAIQRSAQVGSPQFPAQPTGAARCVTCHASEVEGYSNSSMAHSLRRPAQEPQGTVNLPNGKIVVSSSQAGSSQRLESGGDVSEYQVDYVIGSGNHANGYLINLGGHLFQSPIAYYRSREAYDLAPGYENLPYPDFTRPVGEGCVFCHSGTALHIPSTLNQYRAPVFSAEAISCERCHGPVEKHLADPRAETIVNPAKLDAAARDSVCEQCHLFGVARVLSPGKQFSDFLPGQRLEDTFTVYHNAVPVGAAPGAFKVISHVEQLALSTCARHSNGRLWCGTCHDPHDKPREPIQFYRSRCLSCHTADFPASHPAKNTDCISCHMPRRDAKDGGHTAFTDHRIQGHPEAQSDLPADTGIAAWREPSPELQKRNLGIAYIDAGVQHRSQSFIIEGYGMLAEVQSQFATDSELFSWIGQALLLGKQSSEAEIAFDRALQLEPRSPVNEGNSASARAQAGDIQGAIVHLERAVALDPLYLPAAGPLIRLYQKQGKEAEAAALSAKIEAAMHPPVDAAAPGSEQSSAGHAPQTIGEAFKNIQVLKGVPADQLFPTMEFISSALGVECTFCHVQAHFEKDDKKSKQTARNMMRMTFALNKESFDGRREITCYTCHRGAHLPADIPSVAGDAPHSSDAAGAETSKLPDRLPTATQLLDDYITALGGASAIEGITTRVEEGVTTYEEKSSLIEIFSSDSNKRAVVRHLAEGESTTTFDGRNGWFIMPGRPSRPLQGEDLDAARLDADLHFPLHIREIFPELRVEYPEKIGNLEAYVLVGVREGQPLVKFYFDERSGLLVRLVRYTDSVFGLDPTQTDYDDYRNVDGVQVPFRWTLAGPHHVSAIQLKRVQQNVAIDASRFANPPSGAPSRRAP
jgi:photosynthetic reaction center cytochrome c subunit